MSLTPEFIVTLIVGLGLGYDALRKARQQKRVEEKTENVAAETITQTEVLSRLEDNSTEIRKSIGRLDDRMIVSAADNKAANDKQDRRLDSIEDSDRKQWEEISKQQAEMTKLSGVVHRSAAEIALMKQAGKMRKRDTDPLDPDAPFAEKSEEKK